MQGHWVEQFLQRMKNGSLSVEYLVPMSLEKKLAFCMFMHNSSWAQHDTTCALILQSVNEELDDPNVNLCASEYFK